MFTVASHAGRTSIISIHFLICSKHNTCVCPGMMLFEKNPTLLSLCDALLDRILYHVVGSEDVRSAVRTMCLISRRFAQLLKQPLEAWGKLEIDFKGPDLSHVPEGSLAYLTQWLAAVGPAVRELRLFTGWGDLLELQHKLSGAAFLPAMKGLQVLYYSRTHLMPADIVAVAGLTALTSLSCECWLDGVVAPLHSLTSLCQLRKLDLTIQGLPPGEQLPDSLAALSQLESLSLSVGDSAEPSPKAHLRLPWAWCQAAAQLTFLDLHSVDLPQLASNASSSTPSVFPALSELYVWDPVEPLSTSALGCCKSVKVLRLDLAKLSRAGWHVFASLTNLESLNLQYCSPPFGFVPEPRSPSLNGLTALTSLTMETSAFHPAVAQLPALREVELTKADWRQDAGWELPAGPWLQNLERLSLTGCMIGSVEAALRQSTRLTSLTLDCCPWLRFSRDELPLLLALPLRAIKLDKNPLGTMSSLGKPRPLWDENSLWVAEELQRVLWRRGRNGAPGVRVTGRIWTQEREDSSTESEDSSADEDGVADE